MKHIRRISGKTLAGSIIAVEPPGTLIDGCHLTWSLQMYCSPQAHGVVVAFSVEGIERGAACDQMSLHLSATGRWSGSVYISATQIIAHPAINSIQRRLHRGTGL
jgi:hypothetical protein